MRLVLSEDQELLSKTAADFAAEHCSVGRVRALRDSRDPDGFSRDLWKQMGELGWLGILLPEEYGGAEMGLSELAVVLEALGRGLAPEPFLASVLLGAELIARGGSEAQRRAWLPGAAEGRLLLALAQQEPRSRYALEHVETRADDSGGSFTLHGEKVHVEGGAAADALIVVARVAGGERDREGISLFLVPRDAAGLRVEAETRIDGRNAARVLLDGVEVGTDALLGSEGRGLDLLAPVVERARAGLCAEMLGGMSEAFERTLQYLKDRDQFGVPIGSFQGLKHRAARLFIEIELARSSVMAAVRALDADAEEAPRLVSLAKAVCSDAYVRVTNEAVQMHGGIGMTDEHEIGFFMKRARAAELTLGDAAWHRDRWARLSGY